MAVEESARLHKTWENIDNSRFRYLLADEELRVLEEARDKLLLIAKSMTEMFGLYKQKLAEG